MSEIKRIPYSVSAHLSVPTDKNSEKRIYATAQQRGKLNLSSLAAHMAEHTTSFSEGEILGIITDAVNCIGEHLLGGFSVELDSLGKFSVSLKSEGCDSADDFVPAMIRDVSVKFTPSKRLRKRLSEAQFEQVATRELQLKSRKEMRQEANSAVRASVSQDDEPDQGGSGGGITGGDDQTE